ncbi:O-antigen ligase family protein [Bacterioplanoides sp. SCSIO 12839]|uniref:O-antigen ligase family protein n=1 Tax=Bacterioplanoides sp. SCSIO 12839 TaxID=2829569 RepID=UPI002107B942|nr:O-antigen ligase family protein [Bacterioplanoides sp. SCSIO 12839]UTW48991.1 O-antigen ligase family protein [Bacterioplanoides sp. SCSIO 12839]
MRLLEGNGSSISYLWEKYGFCLVLLFCLGVFQADLTSKGGMMEADFSQRMANKSGGNFIKQLFWISFFLFYISRFFLVNSLASKELGKKLFWLLVLPSVALVSAIWAEQSSYVIKRSFFQLCFIFTVCLSFYYSYQRGGLYRSVVVAVCVVFLLTLISIALGAGFTPSGALSAYVAGKNVNAINLIVLIALVTLLIVHMGARKELLWMTFGLMALLILTKSKTNIFIACLFFFLVWLRPVFSTPVVLSLFTGAVMLFVIVPLVTLTLNFEWNPGMSLEPDALTGRGFIWDTLYFDIKTFDKVLLGYGYGGYFGTGSIPFYFDDDFSFIKRITTAHNGYLELILQLGYILTLFVLCFIAYLIKGFSYGWQVSAMAIPIIHNLTESSIFRDQNMIWLLCLIVITSTCFKLEKAKL